MNNERNQNAGIYGRVISEFEMNKKVVKWVNIKKKLKKEGNTELYISSKGKE